MARNINIVGWMDIERSNIESAIPLNATELCDQDERFKCLWHRKIQYAYFIIHHSLFHIPRII